MKIAIHHHIENSFSKHWIKYCSKKNIDFKIVNCYDNDIINQVSDCDALMWHHFHTSPKDLLAAKNILFSLEHSGIKVFPDFHTNWHFDNKLSQKYLFEALNVPLVPSYVFYDKKTAFTWIDNTSFPKVFKLKGGSGSRNVKLVRSKNQAKKLVKKSFGKGFSQFDRYGHLKERYRKFKLGKDTFLGILKGIRRIFVPTYFAKMAGREKGYAYFQDFIPNNDSDYRVIVINKKAIAIKRMVRENDFRASGSGEFYFERENFKDDIIKLAFDTSNKIKSQCCAFDFVYDSNNKPLIVEVSYGFATSGYDKCPGFWDDDLKFHKTFIHPYDWMVEEIINSINNE